MQPPDHAAPPHRGAAPPHRAPSPSPGELEKRYIEAKDNVKFLATLERHFKHILHGSLLQIIDTLPSMMNALRMVWVISRHYKEDQRMEPLMARIAWEVANKISNQINVRTIFRENATSSIKLITEAQAVLQRWESSYMQMRQKIEDSGRDNRWAAACDPTRSSLLQPHAPQPATQPTHTWFRTCAHARWEFDRNKLFSRTRYMAQRCGDLLYAAEMLRDMRAMLGPELKAVTGDAKGIDDVMARVEALVVPLETAPFDFFDRRYQTSWEAAMGKLRENVTAIEEMLKKFMDDSFTKLRTAESAFELLLKFSQISAADASNKLMERKTADILLQYEKEVLHVRTMFEEQQDKPPLCKNQPPLAGAISWSHSLFVRIRRSIAKFQSMEELLQSEQGKEVSKTFVTVSKAIRHYEQGKFEEWRETVNAKAMSLLKQPIFKSVSKDGAEVPPERRDGTETTLVNFDSELTTLIRESKYLDRMGFAVPETALNVTLQEDKYHGYVEALKAMLAAHAQISESLSSVEVQLLQPRIAELRTCLDKGFTLLNWNSLSIPEFTMSCTRAINKFNGLVKQIQKNASIIKGVVASISMAELVSKPSANSDVPELSELYEETERVRTTTLEGLVRQYHQIGPLLIKQEEMVVSSNTGRSPQLRPYYAHWEAQIFGALQAMVSKALTQCLHLLSPKATDAKGGAGRPLFRVGAILSAPEVLVSPPLAEVNKFLSRMVKALVHCCRYNPNPLPCCTLLPCHALPLYPPSHAPLHTLTHPSHTLHTPSHPHTLTPHQVECSRSFVRWMDGTCIETPPQFASEDEDPVVFSFFSDLERSPDVALLTLTVTRAIEKTFGRVNKQLDQYRRYDQLWKVDKAQHLSKFEQRNPTTVMFDSRLQSFSKAVQDARAMPHELEVRLHAST